MSHPAVNPINGQYSYPTAGDGPSDYNMPAKPAQPGEFVDPHNCNADGTLSWVPGNNADMAPDMDIGKSIGGLSGSLKDKIGPFNLDKDADPGTADGRSPKTNV